MKKESSVLLGRKALLLARSAVNSAGVALDAALSVVQTDTMEALVACVGALRSIANAPDGTDVYTLRRIAQSVLKRNKIGTK